MADQDDLPPKPLREPPEEAESGARSFGEMFGALIWVVLFLAVAGGILYLVLHATH